jgi:hypothetical protein
MPVRVLGLVNCIAYVCMYVAYISNDETRNNELKRMWKESVKA